VIGEFASSAWKAGVVRPVVGIGQLAGADVHMDTEQRNLTGAMKAANIAGNAAGTLADIIALSRFVGKGVGALGEAAQIKPLMVEGGMARSLTTSGATGFADGFALNPTQPGEGFGNRLAHGVAEGAGFMALDGTARMLSRVPEGAITGKISSLTGEAASRISNYTPTWVNNFGKAAAESVGQDAKKFNEIVASKFPSLTGENMTRNAIAGYVGGDVYYTADTTLNGKRLDIYDEKNTAVGWAAANALLGGRLAAGRPAEVKVEPPKPEAAPVDKVDPGPLKSDVPPPPSYKPEIKTLENGDQQWTYKDVPNVGDETVYTKGAKQFESHNPPFDWQIKTAEGKIYDRNTKGPWEINYPDGSSLIKSDLNYLSYSKPITVEIGGKPLAVKEVTQLEADQSALAKQWVYEDPAVPDQTVTFNADRTWEAVGADGKSFSYRSRGPWKVTNLDGYVETLKGDGSEIDVEYIPGLSNWRDFAKPAEATAQADGPRKPQAFSFAVSDMSPMSLSELPRKLDVKEDPFS
jgi:hypothetical protein